MNNNQLCFPECGGKKIKIKLAHNVVAAIGSGVIYTKINS